MEPVSIAAAFPLSLAFAFVRGLGARLIELPPMVGFLAAALAYYPDHAAALEEADAHVAFNVYAEAGARTGNPAEWHGAGVYQCGMTPPVLDIVGAEGI